jgi:hypothetical protein
LERVREQARLQVESRASGKLVYQTLPPLPGFGLARLPSPSDGDIFLDFEGDPFVDEAGSLGLASMSRGPGRVEKQLSEIFLKNPKQGVSTSELCRKVYRTNQVKKKHRVSVLRALDRMSKRSRVNVWRAVLRGSRDDLWFDYAPQARLRSDIAPAKDKRPQKPVPQKYRRRWEYKVPRKSLYSS